MSTLQSEVQMERTQAIKILNLMKESRIYWQAKKETVNGVLKAKGGGYAVSLQDIIDNLANSVHGAKINGLITNCLQKSTQRQPLEKDSNADIEWYRVKWSQMLVKEFNNIASKTLRQEEYGEEDESVSYIYDSSSMVQFLCSIKAKNPLSVRDSSIFLFPNEVLKVPKYSVVRSKYAFLLHNDNIIGSDLDSDLREREKKAEKIAGGENIASEIENYLCNGCVNGERIQVYRRYFECFYECSGKRVEYGLYERLWQQIIRSDSKQILRDAQYFVFKEEIQKVYQIFLCDRQLGQMVRIRQLSHTETKLDKFAPIHSSLPCKSFAIYIAPFCYSSTSPQDIYEIFRQVYANYFILLNTLSSLPDSILSLCTLFEEILWSTERKLTSKLEELQVQPLRIVFPWMFYCFIGYIQVEQFFLLLDRIIGLKSMEILPLYCVSIFFKEKAAILEAKDQAEIQEILEDSLKEDVFLETIRDFIKLHL